MKAAKFDRSGIFDDVTTSWVRPASNAITQFQVSERGLTFRSATRVSPWTEMEAEVELPGNKSRRVLCRGIIVQCETAPDEGGYDVTMLFLDVNKRAIAELQKASTKPISSGATPRISGLGANA